MADKLGHILPRLVWVEGEGQDREVVVCVEVTRNHEVEAYGLATFKPLLDEQGLMIQSAMSQALAYADKIRKHDVARRCHFVVHGPQEG